MLASNRIRWRIDRCSIHIWSTAVGSRSNAGLPYYDEPVRLGVCGYCIRNLVSLRLPGRLRLAPRPELADSTDIRWLLFCPRITRFVYHRRIATL